MVATIESAVAAGASAARDKATGQAALFGGADSPADAHDAPMTALASAEPWSMSQALTYEKEMLGMYISSHPLDRWADEIQTLGAIAISDIKESAQDAVVVIVGLVQGVRTIVTRTGRNPGQKMGIVTLADLQGSIECVLFPKVYAQCDAMLEPERALVFLGRVDQSRGDTQVIVEQILTLQDAKFTLARAIEITIDDRALNGATAQTLELVHERLRSFAINDHSSEFKPAPVTLSLHVEGKRVQLEAGRTLRVRPNGRLLEGIAQTVGADCVRVITGPPIFKKNDRSRPRQRS